MRQQLKLWDSKRERELTCEKPQPKAQSAVCRTKDREELASCGPAHPLPEAGGSGELATRPERGKLSPRDGIPYQTSNRLPVSKQRLLEILDG